MQSSFVDGDDASLALFRKCRVKGPSWFPGASQRVRRQKPHSWVLCRFLRWLELARRETWRSRTSSGTSEDWQGQWAGLHHPATCLPVMTRRLELRTMLPFFPSEYQRRLKSATNDLPVSCFIFVTDFLHDFLQDQSLCHILLSFHEYSLLSSVLYSPLHIIDLITQVK